MATAEQSLEVDLIGPLVVRRDGTPVDLPPSKKARALLAYLVLTKRSHTRARLCEMFFDVADDPRAGLRWCLSRLRSALGDTDHEIIVTSRSDVSVNTDGISVDVLNIRKRCQGGIESLQTAQLEELVGALSRELLEGLDFADLHTVQAWCLAERSEMRALTSSLRRERRWSLSLSARYARSARVLRDWGSFRGSPPRLTRSSPKTLISRSSESPITARESYNFGLGATKNEGILFQRAFKRSLTRGLPNLGIVARKRARRLR